MAEHSVGRREFAFTLASGAAAVSLAATPGGEKGTRLFPGHGETARPAPATPPPSQIDLLLDVVRRRYPDKRLTDEVLEAIGHDLRETLDRSKLLADFPLANADEPGVVFAAYRGGKN